MPVSHRAVAHGAYSVSLGSGIAPNRAPNGAAEQCSSWSQAVAITLGSMRLVAHTLPTLPQKVGRSPAGSCRAALTSAVAVPAENVNSSLSQLLCQVSCGPAARRGPHRSAHSLCFETLLADVGAGIANPGRSCRSKIAARRAACQAADCPPPALRD